MSSWQQIPAEQINSILAASARRTVHPLASPTLPGHDKFEDIHAQAERSKINKTIYRSQLKSDAQVASEIRRNKLISFLDERPDKEFSAPRLQDELGVSKRIMQSDLKALRDQKLLRFAIIGRNYFHFSVNRIDL